MIFENMKLAVSLVVNFGWLSFILLIDYNIQSSGILSIMPLVPSCPCSVPSYPLSLPGYPESVPACPELVSGCLRFDLSHVTCECPY